MRILLTGGSGFFGSYLLRALSPAHDIYLLTHRASVDGYANGKSFQGDVAKAFLGLDPLEMASLNFDAILHSAGVVSFRKRDRLRDINIGGTINAAGLAARLKIPLYHISSSYVCGDFKGVYYEHDRYVGQKFRNWYEHSKFNAEVAVREGAIFRPSVLIDDTLLHGIPPLHGYRAVRAMDGVKSWVEKGLGLPPSRITLRIPARPSATINMIPVDIAARQIAEIISSGLKIDDISTFHITNPSPPTVSLLCNSLSRALSMDIVPVETFTPNPAERLLAWAIGDLLKYTNGEPMFDRANTSRAVTVECPVISEEFLMKVAKRYMRWSYGVKEAGG